MIRVLNFFCVALMGLSILALYHVSEQTRLAHVALNSTNVQIAKERTNISVMEVDWEHLASPERIATLAQSKLGLDNTPTVQLSSLELLPRRGEDDAPLTPSPVRRASDVVPAQPAASVEAQ
jgi:cell division protein FtsL